MRVEASIRWLRPCEAARLLGVSKRTLYRWELRGFLKPDRTPTGYRRYKLAALEELLAHQR